MDKIPTVVVIPTIYINYLFNILDVLIKDDSIDLILVYDNGYSGPDYERLWNLHSVDSRIHVQDAKGLTIYQMWNLGWETGLLGSKDGLLNLALLNDDIYIGPDTIKVLADFLRSDDTIGLTFPDYNMSVNSNTLGPYSLVTSHSTFGHGGVSGFAFMFKGELPIEKFDENVTWWYGDDMLIMEIESKGYSLQRVLGLPLEHAGSLSARRKPEIEAAIQKDIEYFNKKTGESRTRW